MFETMLDADWLSLGRTACELELAAASVVTRPDGACRRHSDP